ncbi:Predicted dithiol-disulfide oxidoreductase, DUF899 family [Rhizobiales bacterium GAS188]|nr:Predicted dithiol-disulfide oxidoreductase, DUF899 family [Rhizobiales bacterium GAS188]
MMHNNPIVSRDEWLTARRELLYKEKKLTRQRDRLNAERRALPWVKVEKPYVFDGPNGPVALADLFDGRSQLIIYHFMFGPGWQQGCPSCSLIADQFDSALVHLEHRDVTLVAVSRATLPEIEAFRKRMGWRFTWVSSHDNGFNADYRVSFTKDEMTKGEFDYNYGLNAFPREEAPGASVFYKDAAGEVFHTYSCYARGAEPLIGTYAYLDLTPKGRDEAQLPFPMAWIRHHDRYVDNPVAKGKASARDTAAA